MDPIFEFFWFLHLLLNWSSFRPKLTLNPRFFSVCKVINFTFFNWLLYRLRHRLAAFEAHKGRCPITMVKFNPQGNMLFYAMSYDWCKGAEHNDPKVRNDKRKIIMISCEIFNKFLQHLLPSCIQINLILICFQLYFTTLQFQDFISYVFIFHFIYF